MPKLDNLKRLVDSLEKPQGVNEDSIRSMFSESSASSANVVTFRIESAMKAMLSEFANAQAESRKEVLKAVGEMLLSIAKDQESLEKKITQLDKSLSGTQNSVSDAVKSSESELVKALGESVKANANAVSRVEKMVSEISFPEPEKIDFSMLETMLVKLSEQVAEPQAKVEWVFDVERDVNNRLDRVVARPMDAA